MLLTLSHDLDIHTRFLTRPWPPCGLVQHIILPSCPRMLLRSLLILLLVCAHPVVFAEHAFPFHAGPFKNCRPLLSSQQLSSAGAFISILQMRKLRLREVKKLVYSHTTTKRWNSNLGLVDSKAQISSIICPWYPYAVLVFSSFSLHTKYFY